ncbi:MAG TPA: DUF2336 domain-containing protein [Vitreimonas sp.]|uniref:DUF2336 domain-containing protein n=1 Tax=Vitreimonas sp. TaxID=3069702 RepID=UPI002D4222CD|nr:DUF2336 domain-containing protein [Vitreimonas sp.]HYD88292.1 DUF2336 domain-containing protein [Vitreimonas sp.]
MSIVTMRANLTDSDIRTLIKGPTEDARAQAAHKICRCIEDAELSADDRAHAEGIISIMAQDAAVLVRRALAVALKNSPKLPREIANKLARDLDSIALPVIMNSPSLTDSDLVEIVRASPPAKQVAVASREKLTATVTGALSAYAVSEAVERALANDNAAFDETGLQSALQRFPEISSVTAAMVRRETLPVSVTEKLVAMVTGELFDHLVNNHELPPQIAIDLAMGARERATIDIVEQAARQSDLPRFVQQLNLNGRLTPSLLMRGLCLGHLDFVEHAMAELGGLPHQRMWLLMHDSGPLGLKAAFDRAGLPPRLFSSFRAAVEVYHSVEREAAAQDRITFRKRMLERTLTLFQSVPKDDLDYLLDKLDASGLQSERVAAI